MRIGIIGAGNVGGALTRASRKAGHTVAISAAEAEHAAKVAAETGATAAKSLSFVASLGFRPIDAGPLAMARALEGMGTLNIALNMSNGWPWQSGWKLVGPTG